jgi:predicted dehydrogenase
VPIPSRLVGEFLDLPDYYTPFRGCFGRMAREVVEAIREGRDAAPSFWDGLRVQEVLDAALLSARHKTWITVERHHLPELGEAAGMVRSGALLA